MANAPCAQCISASKTKRKKRVIGIPVSYCENCKTARRVDNVTEYAALSRGKQRRFFINFGVVFFSIIFAAGLCTAVYFLLPKIISLGKFAKYLIYFSIVPVVTLPLFIALFKGFRKIGKKDAILKSKKRCSYREYLMYLNDRGITVAPKAMAQANKILDADTYLTIFGDLSKDDRFLTRLSAELYTSVMEKTGRDLVEDIKNDSRYQTKEEVAQDPTILQNDIDSIEKYIQHILKKYNLKCSEGRQQNIKINLITYIESVAEPDSTTLKKIVFETLKENN